MSSDYRPRGGNKSNSDGSMGGSGSGRRRRGGRGRGGRRTGSAEGYASGNGTHSRANGHGHGHTHTPKKKNPIAAFFSWITGGGKKSTPASRPAPRPHDTEHTRTPRPERSERPARPERNDRPERLERSERPAREERPEPTPQEIVTPKLYVGNLAYEAGESDLFDLFSKIGSVKNVEIAMDRRSNRSKGFGFVEMEVLETAVSAAEKLNRSDFMGRQIVVSGAKMERSRVNRDEAPEEGETETGSESASSSEGSSI